MRTNKWLSYEDNGAVLTVERHLRLPYVDQHRNPPIPQSSLSPSNDAYDVASC